MMKLEYIPLLPIQRDLYRIPRGMDRFRAYLGTMTGQGDPETGMLLPLVAMNPMGKEHVTARLDALLALDADAIAARAAADTAARLTDVPGEDECKAALVVVDDLRGGWTNRWATEHAFRFPGPPFHEDRPRWLKFFWITGVLWSSEEPTEETIRQAILTALYRTAYLRSHGPAATLRQKLAQEGWVLAMAGSAAPVLDPDDLAYTRAVIEPHLDAADMRTAVECLFGDAAAHTLGFTPRGLSPWAGLALALADTRAAASAVRA